MLYGFPYYGKPYNTYRNGSAREIADSSPMARRWLAEDTDSRVSISVADTAHRVGIKGIYSACLAVNQFMSIETVTEQSAVIGVFMAYG